MTTTPRQIMADANIPALSLAVFECDKVLFTWAGGPSVTTATPFPICCLGKPVTALAMLLLQEQGRLQLDHPAVRYIPRGNMPRPHEAAGSITIRHLLSHSAGIIRGSFRQHQRTREEYADEAQGSDLVYAPGLRYKFSNLGYSLCGAIIETVAGISYQDFVTRRIFRPLGMTSATFEDAATTPVGHSRGEYYALVHGDDALHPAPKFPLPVAAGAFYCTAQDYARLFAALTGHSGGPISPQVREAFLRVNSNRADLDPVLRYTGSNSGYSSLVIADTRTGKGAVAFCNRANASAPLGEMIEAAGIRPASSEAVELKSFDGDFRCGAEVLRVRPNGRGLSAELGPIRFGLNRKGAKSFVPDGGPLREYVMRFVVRGDGMVACSAGPKYFGASEVTNREESHPAWGEIAGRYICPGYATAEIFVRRGRLYCLCSPLHEMRMIPVSSDFFTLRNGLFAGEALRVHRSRSGDVRGVEMG
ncbi:MAG TPA: serine hydrolase domain-containing protein, partial [Bryobacteraceae bacterium]|nr:serine hydrolase domain-containing protein [Bryobacteraceae bacterium]